MTAVDLEAPDVISVDIPPIKEYLKAKQRTARPSCT